MYGKRSIENQEDTSSQMRMTMSEVEDSMIEPELDRRGPSSTCHEVQRTLQLKSCKFTGEPHA